MPNLISFNIIWIIANLGLILIAPRTLPDICRLIGLFTSTLVLWFWIGIMGNFDFGEITYQFQFCFNFLLPSAISEFSGGVDGFALCLILLTAIIMPICIYAGGNVTKNMNEFLACVLLIELFLIISFVTTNMFIFFIFFESVLIPMFIMIGYWGSRDRKIKAAYYFFFYTLFGSLFMLFGMLYIWNITGSLNYIVLINQKFSIQSHIFLFILFFIPFAIKIPMFPFHIWLPEAHVEAPTIGSIILASLLLKLGSFGFWKFTIPLFWYGVAYFSLFIDALSILSIVYASLATIRQIDMKKIIAYSSIAHMNLIVLGLFSLNQHGIDGSIYLMIGHGIVSSALFYCVGVLYDRYHTRLLKYYGGLVILMPWFTIFFLLFTLANMSFPGTSNFIGEFVILLGVFSRNSFAALCGGTGIVLSALYSIWLFNRICFGTLKIRYINKYQDLNLQEFQILFTLFVLQTVLGLSSKTVFDFIWWNSYAY